MIKIEITERKKQVNRFVAIFLTDKPSSFLYILSQNMKTKKNGSSLMQIRLSIVGENDEARVIADFIKKTKIEVFTILPRNLPEPRMNSIPRLARGVKRGNKINQRVRGSIVESKELSQNFKITSAFR